MHLPLQFYFCLFFLPFFFIFLSLIKHLKIFNTDKFYSFIETLCTDAFNFSKVFFNLRNILAFMLNGKYHQIIKTFIRFVKH